MELLLFPLFAKCTEGCRQNRSPHYSRLIAVFQSVYPHIPILYLLLRVCPRSIPVGRVDRSALCYYQNTRHRREYLRLFVSSICRTLANNFQLFPISSIVYASRSEFYLNNLNHFR